MDRTIRIANAGGFWGDWLEAPKRQVLGGEIDYLTLDYLAELTMSMLSKQKESDPRRGFVYDFVRLCETLLPEIIDRGIKIVANAGGVNPEACGAAVRAVAEKLALSDKVKIALVTGDDILEKIPALRAAGESFSNFDSGTEFETIAQNVQSANAYIGSQGISDALAQGANIVICGRVFDAGLVLGPLRYEFGWSENDLDKLASGVVIGHILECGAQATGGNCSANWGLVLNREEIGFPIAEVTSSGEAIITKHDHTGGEVTLQSVKEQLVYELGDPKNYITPDVIADFTTVKLEQVGEDRVKVSGVRGRKRPEKLKVSIAYSAGFRGEGTLLLSWPAALKKAKECDRIIRSRANALGLKFDEMLTEFIGANAAHGLKSELVESSVTEVLLRIAVRGPVKADIDRFLREIPPLVLSGPPGISGYAGDRGSAQSVFGYWPTLVSRSAVEETLGFV